MSSPFDSHPPSSLDPDRASAGPPALTREMEDEVFSLLGALLGLLEVLSIDVREPLTTRQRGVVDDALKFGDKLRSRIEALVTLLGDGRDPRYQPSRYALRRLVDHAVRGANWSASEKGVRLLLPDTESFGQETVLIDATRVDRALRAITDTLVASLQRDDALHVSARREDQTWILELRPESRQPASLELPRLLVLAWHRLFELQGGALSVSQTDKVVRVQLQRGEAR